MGKIDQTNYRYNNRKLSPIERLQIIKCKNTINTMLGPRSNNISENPLHAE